MRTMYANQLLLGILWLGSLLQNYHWSIQIIFGIGFMGISVYNTIAETKED